MDVETEIKNIFVLVFKTDVIRQVFASNILEEKNTQEDLHTLALQKFQTLFKSQKPDDQAKLIPILLKYIHSQLSPRRVHFLFKFLDNCISTGTISVKVVLDELQCSALVYTKKQHWCLTYEIIRKYIHKVDYKGCRNLLQVMITKMKEIPSSSWQTCSQQVQCICDLIAYVIDSESCLLPGYLAVNEFNPIMLEEKGVVPPPLQDVLLKFVNRFCATASMVTTSGRWALLPIVDHTSYQLPVTWKLEPERLRFPLKRPLPYCKEMCQTQHRLMRHILMATTSREMLQQVIGISKQQQQQQQRCPALETEVVDLLVDVMEKCDTLLSVSSQVEEFSCQKHLIWLHLCSLLIHLVIYQMISFPYLLEKLHSKLLSKKQSGFDIRKGREYLTWCLLHYISGSIHKYPLSDFTPVAKLINMLYHESEPLPLPDISKSQSAINFSAICVLTHLTRKVQSVSAGDDGVESIDIPKSLYKHYNFVQQCLLRKSSINLQDYRISLLCNACNTTTDVNSAPVTVLLDSISGDRTGIIKTEPLQMELLDSLTSHPKMSMLHQIGSKIQALSHGGNAAALSPALTETYSRLLAYSELESLGMKSLVVQVFPKICEFKNWGMLNLVVEMVSYRTYHIPPSSRMQLLTLFHSLANSQHNFPQQLLYSIENASLRLMVGFGNFDIKPQLMRALNEKKIFVSQTSEELNRVLVLKLAQSIHITGAGTVSEPWCMDVLESAMAATPHKWPVNTLGCFPASLQEHYQHQQTEESVNKKNLKARVEEEYLKWGPLLAGEGNPHLSEVDALKHFCLDKNAPPFICLVWKVLFEGKQPSIIIYKILKSMTSQQLSGHIGMFSDFLVPELFTSEGQQAERVQLFNQVILDMVWKYNIVPLDRLILCLTLRFSDPKDVQTAFFIIQYLLMKSDDFRSQIRIFVQEVENTDYWKLSDWHRHHLSFQQKIPEKYFFEGLQRHCIGKTSEQTETESGYLPTHFGNIIFRFLSVIDILIHRCLEDSKSKSLEVFLNHFDSLYKFHDKPITYLFTTLHYYENRLRDQHALKRKLVSSIVMAISEGRPESWALSNQFMSYLSGHALEWKPTASYYVYIVRRLVDTMLEKDPPAFTPRDWRFNEFSNPCAHALHVTCVEVLSLPISSEEVGKSIMDVVLHAQPGVVRNDILSWMNAVALILTALPDMFWKPLHEEILSVLGCSLLTSPVKNGSPYPYHVFDFNKQSYSCTASYCTRLLALTHIVWHHMSIGQLSTVSLFLKDRVKPIIATEMQLLYIFHLIGPYFSRFRSERTRCMIDVATSLYDMLLQVSEGKEEIYFVDEIADFLYNIKYMHIGQAILDKTVEVVTRLQPKLRRLLQFITQAPKSQT